MGNGQLLGVAERSESSRNAGAVADKLNRLHTEVVQGLNQRCLRLEDARQLRRCSSASWGYCRCRNASTCPRDRNAKAARGRQRSVLVQMWGQGPSRVCSETTQPHAEDRSPGWSPARSAAGSRRRRDERARQEGQRSVVTIDQTASCPRSPLAAGSSLRLPGCTRSPSASRQSCRIRGPDDDWRQRRIFDKLRVGRVSIEELQQGLIFVNFVFTKSTTGICPPRPKPPTVVTSSGSRSTRPASDPATTGQP